MSEISELKRLAEETKGWDNLKSCWPEETEDGDLEVNWFVGAVTEDDDKYPVLEVNTAQYDALEDAGRLARYYAAANPAAVLALIAENERLAAQARLAGVSAEMTVHQAVGRAATEALLVMHERDQLKAENEALRAKLENPDPILIQCLDGAIAEQDQLEKDAARYRWTSTEGNWVARMFGKWRAHIGAYGDASPTEWYETREEAIDAAMGKAVKP
ncbi:hypothetical protein [Pseudomonas jessenii]|uniref:Ead/Ea22-like family protein n=1 Tax=Pseudomonas jessenii TaxID=77298 RepID=A0A370S1E3_PSEJE|nr:hypothetical protein [Pseudomonas jessenii]RDL13589.1 hypothetical protein DEU51_12466 [Pseudomonas jessenii]